MIYNSLTLGRPRAAATGNTGVTILIIAVLTKRVPDTASTVTVRPDGKRLELDGLKFVMNPYDEYAVEEAIRLRERVGGEVIVICAGGEESRETIRSGLAMGADSGLLLTGTEAMTSEGLATVVAAGLKSLSATVIFAGKQSVDSDGSQTAERVAELMGIPHASCITRFELKGEKAEVDREIEGGHYRLALELPALFTTQKGINTPRYPTLPNIMKAKRAPIRETAAGDLPLDPGPLAPGMHVERYTPSRQERRRTILQGPPEAQAEALCRALCEDEKVL